MFFIRSLEGGNQSEVAQLFGLLARAEHGVVCHLWAGHPWRRGCADRMRVGTFGSLWVFGFGFFVENCGREMVVEAVLPADSVCTMLGDDP